jgi:hypothetical protein
MGVTDLEVVPNKIPRPEVVLIKYNTQERKKTLGASEQGTRRPRVLEVLSSHSLLSPLSLDTLSPHVQSNRATGPAAPPLSCLQSQSTDRGDANSGRRERSVGGRLGSLAESVACSRLGPSTSEPRTTHTRHNALTQAACAHTHSTQTHLTRTDSPHTAHLDSDTSSRHSWLHAHRTGSHISTRTLLQRVAKPKHDLQTKSPSPHREYVPLKLAAPLAALLVRSI